jgi:hypothetical protein
LVVDVGRCLGGKWVHQHRYCGREVLGIILLMVVLILTAVGGGLEIIVLVIVVL